MKTISIFILISFFAIAATAQRISDLPQNKAAKAAQPVQTGKAERFYWKQN